MQCADQREGLSDRLSAFIVLLFSIAVLMDAAYERQSLISSRDHLRNGATCSRSEEIESNGTTQPKSAKLSRRQWLTVLVFGVANLTSAVCISLQAPFYPLEVSIYFIIIIDHDFNLSSISL